jgi:glucose/arabinose dehydrogenase
MSRLAPLLVFVGLAPSTLLHAQVIPGDLTPQVYVTGLSSPVGLTHAGDGRNRLFVVQQGGQVRVINASGSLLSAPYLTINASSTCRYGPSLAPSTTGFTSGGERGLLGLAFHPDFARNGRIFVSYTDGNGDNLVVRYTLADPSVNQLSAADLDTCLVVLRIDQDFSNHNGGHVAFGPDGYLYFAPGDGGSGNDPCNRAQLMGGVPDTTTSGCALDFNTTPTSGNPESIRLLGKMLRIDVDGSTPAGTPGICGQARNDQPAAYAIPADNPFNGSGIADGCDEVWSLGLRNPWRYSFDRVQGDLWIGDVGQGAQEEVDFEPRGSGGLNYGWRCLEGTRINTTSGINTIAPCPDLLGPTPPANLRAPVITYPRTDGFSITGGYRYRGPNFAIWGRYIYADYGNGNVWFVLPPDQGGSWTPTRWLPTGGGLGFNVSSFGEDEGGQVYLVDYSGRIVRIGPNVPQPIFGGPINGGFESPIRGTDGDDRARPRD